MTSQNNKININFFSKLVNKYGENLGSVNWRSKSSQMVRFEKLFKIGVTNRNSILDIGCGIGDMYKYINNLQLDVKYLGIDITPKMVEFCKERFPENKNHFQNVDILTLKDEFIKYDWVFASGIFYLLKVKPFDAAIELIHKMYSFSKKGVAFNSLSSWAENKTENEFYMDPLKLLDRLKNDYPNLVFFHDYHPSDFTIYIYK